MTTGTNGDDDLSNNTSVYFETIDALDGNDVVTINPPTVSPASTVTANGGNGSDTLKINAYQITGINASGYDGSGGMRFGTTRSTTLEWTSFERVELNGALYGSTTSVVTGDSVDVLRLSSQYSSTNSISTGTGNDEIHFSTVDGYGGTTTIDGGDGDDIIDFSGVVFGGGAQNQIAYGGIGNDSITGSKFGDLLDGGAGNDVIDGAAGDDRIVLSGGGNDSASGGEGNDYFYFGAAFDSADSVDGGAGTDTVGLLGNYNLTLGANTLAGVETFSLLSGTAAGGTEHVTYSITTVDENVPAGGRLTVYAGGLLSDETLFFNGYAETNGALSVYGGAANDTFAGGPANDAFVGGAGNDTMYGLGGMDWLEGGLGADQMRGGFGNDLFVYQSAAESTAAATDHILDFEHISDHISLTNVDANANVDGDQAFTFIGSSAFSNTAGELRAYQSGASWFVEGDVNGDGTADLVIQVDAVGGHTLVASDFFL